MPEVFVNVYEVRREYGGPEEGGWYYDTGTPVLSERFEDELLAYHRATWLRNEYPDTGYSTSVRPLGADYRVVVERGPAEYYPTERPHYE